MKTSSTLLLGFVLLILLCMISIIMQSIHLMEHHDVHVTSEESIGNIPIDAMVSIGTEPLEHEKMFEDTLKDCMPFVFEDGDRKKNKKECKTFVPEGSKERIGVLAPPGKMTSALVKFINIVLAKAKKEGGDEIAATGAEVISTTHMAPYGYGKTHGLTRMIRVVPQPLLLGTTDTLKAAVQSSPTPMSLNDITINDLKAALRQQIRYHCRLNHIAAHTAMWTIGVEDFAEIGREVLVETAQEFFGLDMDQDDLLNLVINEYDKLGDDDDENQGVVEKDDDDNSLAQLNYMYADGAKLMGLMQTKAKSEVRKAKAKEKTNDILKMLDDVLLDEMKISNNLTNWPCESFWTVGEPDNRLELSPIIRSISAAMSPNCTAPYTTCFVKKDKCEAKGDGVCN